MTEFLSRPRAMGKNSEMKKSMIELEGGTVLKECQECKSTKLLDVTFRMSAGGCQGGLKCMGCGVLYIVKGGV